MIYFLAWIVLWIVSSEIKQFPDLGLQNPEGAFNGETKANFWNLSNSLSKMRLVSLVVWLGWTKVKYINSLEECLSPCRNLINISYYYLFCLIIVICCGCLAVPNSHSQLLFFFCSRNWKCKVLTFPALLAAGIWKCTQFWTTGLE